MILGISCFYHDSAAALLRDGQLVAAAEEERFNRKKHYNEFPERAVNYCLQTAGVGIDQVDHIVFYEKPLVKFNRILETVLAGWPRTGGLWLKSMPDWLTRKLRVGQIIQDKLQTDKTIHYCPHHMAHAASAFLASPFEEAAIMTADGVGEWTTTAWGVGQGGGMEMKQELRFPHSIGLLFSAVTSYLGFRVNDAEWKVMGLAPYGQPRYLVQFRELVDMREDGSFRLNMKYFAYTHSTEQTCNNRAWQRLFGRPPRASESEIDEFYTDMACSGQRMVEELMLNMARAVHHRTGMKNLTLAGGVGLNCVANWRILQESGFENIFIQPAAGDSGGALGAALYFNNCVLGNPRQFVMDHALYGPSFSDTEIRAALDGVEAIYDAVESDEELADRTARMIAEGKVVAWFQGRMEYGPRALGARSLLADARHPGMKDIINSKVKYREAFRPFAPAVLKERAHEYFDMPRGMDAPFMLLVPKVRPERRDEIPAVTHADGSGRVQTVTAETNPLYYQVIRRFGELTGTPVVINTSFNVRGEPIVCTPRDAYSTFVKCGIDALVIGRNIITEKPGQVDFEAGMRRSVALEASVLVAH